MNEKFYRLYDSLEEDGIFVKLKTFTAIKETPCGHWVVSRYAPQWLEPEELIKRKFAKWISKTSCKKHCYQDINDAIKSFSMRKQSQLHKLRDHLEQCEKVVKEQSKWQQATLKSLHGSGINLGTTSLHNRYFFDF